MSIASTYLFRIGDKDYTTYIKVPTYTVNKEDVYDEWTDANHNQRRDIIRTQVSGAFTMIFADKVEYLEFLDLLRDLKAADGTTLASLYSNKTNEIVTARYYIDFTPANEMPYMGIKECSGINMTVKEF